MKKRISSLALLLVLVLSLGLTAGATDDVSPRWDNIERCTPTLILSGQTATCTASIKAHESTARISASMTLYRLNATGSRTQIASWTNLTGTGRLDVSRTHAPLVRGATYYLAVTGTVTDSTGSHPLGGSVSAK